MLAMGDGLDMESILGDAIAKAGIDDTGDDWFLTPLEAWSQDLESDNLTDSGRAFLRRLAVNDIVRRLEVLKTIRDHPEILDVEVPPIVYITGLERSGTTILHNLLALHPQMRPLLRWELMHPVPPPETASYATDERIAATQASIEPLRGSLLERMHWVNADEPEECTWAMIDMVGLLGQAPTACMPAWSRFIRSTDMTPAFEHYRQVIQLLLWKHPVAPGQRLVLKAPQTSSHLAQFAAVFPDAHFVVPDRDPYRVVSSTMVMVASLMDAFCVENPIRNPGPDGHDWIGTTARRLRDIARFDDEQPDRIAHVPYPLLASDPRAAVTAVVREVGLPVDADYERAVDAFIDAQRAGKRPTPPKHLDATGLDRDDLMASPEIAAYCDRFAIAPEEQRLTGAAPTN
ncbi:MAG: putative sulfotransferase [Acidimicrobiales bacterium]|nr:MAG: putative sulfotransferase [Acidimicrobiales bacterium]